MRLRAVRYGEAIPVPGVAGKLLMPSRSPAAAFHARLKRFYAAYFGTKGGAA